MGKNANFVSHKKSKLKENGGPKLPLASDLVEGEIAINFGKDVETLSIRNESGDVVTFSSDNYYTEKKLGSGFTGENSANTVTSVVGSGFTSSSITDVIIENEKIVSAALTDLDERKLDASAYTPSVGLWVSGTGENAIVQKNGGNTASGKLSVAMGSGTTASGDYSVAEGRGTSAMTYYSHAEGYNTIANGVYSHTEGSNTIALNQAEHASGQYNISSSGSSTFGHSGNTLFSVGNGESNGERHNAFEIKQNGDIYITSGNSDIKLQDYIGGGGSITVDQVLDDTTSASTNPVSSKAVYDAVTDNELVWTNAYVTLSGTVSAHTANTEIHVTAADKTAWDAKLDATAYTPTDLSNYYTKSETSGATEISTALGAYYTKSDTSGATEISNALAGKSDTGHTHEASGVTAMTGYHMAASSASVLTTDTLLQVIGKLEKRIALLETALGGMSLVKISSTDYENLNPKDPNTLYIIND